MDITNIPQNLIKALEQKNTEQLATLSRVLNLVVGKTLMASVISAEPVSPQDRAALLKQTSEALAQITKQAANPSTQTPAVKAEIARLVQQQQMLQSPQLKWVNLVVNGKPVVTYSDRPLNPGQTISLQLQTPQKLVVLDTTAEIPKATSQVVQPGDVPEKDASDSLVKDKAALNQLVRSAILELIGKSQIAPNTNLAKNILVENAPAHLLKAVKDALANAEDNSATTDTDIPEAADKLTKNQTAAPKTPPGYSAKNITQQFLTKPETHSPEFGAGKKIIGDTLRQLLPLKHTPDTLLLAANQLQQLPRATRSALLSPTLEQALKRVAEQIRSPEQLSQPKVLAQSIKNSGIFFEAKLQDAVKNNATNTAHHQPTMNAAVERTFSQDLKGALLTLLNKSSQSLQGDNRPLSSAQTLQIFQQLASTINGMPGEGKTNFPKDIESLLQQLLSKPLKELLNKDFSGKDASAKEMRNQLLMLLQQHSVHSLAKIQLQQLHSLAEALDKKDPAAPVSSWQLDIPVKHQEHLQHIHVRIDRDWVEEKNDAETKGSAAKVKQWSVILRFDLPSLGEFCAQLAVVDTRVSATLWAAQEKTFARVAKHIEGLRQQLEQEGIEVKQLQCLRGMPPEKPLALSYSLIDVST